MKIKQYSLAAHLIHSRLQLINKKIRINTLSDGRELAMGNYLYFYRAGESVFRDHEIRFKSRDLFDAGEIFLMSVDEFKMTSYYVVQKSNGVAIRKDITTYDLGITISDADPKARWTREEAVLIRDAIINHHKLFGFHVVRIWEYK